jgi:hypothetical protein
MSEVFSNTRNPINGIQRISLAELCDLDETYMLKFSVNTADTDTEINAVKVTVSQLAD